MTLAVIFLKIQLLLQIALSVPQLTIHTTCERSIGILVSFSSLSCGSCGVHDRHVQKCPPSHIMVYLFTYCFGTHCLSLFLGRGSETIKQMTSLDKSFTDSQIKCRYDSSCCLLLFYPLNSTASLFPLSVPHLAIQITCERSNRIVCFLFLIILWIMWHIYEIYNPETN